MELLLGLIGILVVGILLAAAYLTTRGYGLIRIGWLNFSRLQEMDRKWHATADPLEKNALEFLVGHCQSIRKKWILDESDLHITENTQKLVTGIASFYQPDSANPVFEARIGQLLTAFLELRDKILVLQQSPGLRAVTQFRLRHIFLLTRAWKLKTRWRESPFGQAVARYKLAVVFEWLYMLIRFMDVTFWAVKMIKDLSRQVVFKILLVRWYLMVGDLAMNVYRDRAPTPEMEGEDLLGEMENIPEQELPAELSGKMRELVDASRRTIMFNTKALEWDHVQGIYSSLVEDIARFYHPGEKDPLYEARIFDLLLGAARLTEEISQIRNKPVLNKLLDLRVSHILMMKDAADYLRDSEFLGWIRKYQLHHVFRFSNLLYQILRKKHPGILFKDFAFTLVKESGKRWVWVYLHDKIAVEANHIYEKSKQ